MKVLCQFARKNLKYSLCFLTLTILAVQIFHLVNEGEKHHVNTVIEHSETENCPKQIDIWMSVFKCSLAFLFGGLLSDMKFLKFGIM